MSIRIRKAVEEDLPAINAVVNEAVMSWNLPQRVKRLAVSSYLYTAVDFVYLELWLAVSDSGKIFGVAAWEPADTKDLPPAKSGLLLHGIYVDPMQQGRGIGRLLFETAMRAVTETSLDGLLVKAQEDALGFFMALGMHRLPVLEQAHHYDKRYWLEPTA